MKHLLAALYLIICINVICYLLTYGSDLRLIIWVPRFAFAIINFIIALMAYLITHPKYNKNEN